MGADLNMRRRFLILLLVVTAFTGCIESGSFNVAGDGGSFKLPDFRMGSSSLETDEAGSLSSTGDLAVPMRSLPRHFLRSSESGSYSESFSLEGLPSTSIVWRVEKDPFEKVFQSISEDSNSKTEIDVDGTLFDVEVEKRHDLYRLAAHYGLYTFIAETTSPGEIENARAYGSAAEVVETVFVAGLKNALSYDLESLRN
ncbi:MAG TPA: hypothetical protein ENH13_03110 [Euryarchaeota archaeon]|nr:hypothetical protein [Euryarchaeota archaeon]